MLKYLLWITSTALTMTCVFLAVFVYGWHRQYTEATYWLGLATVLLLTRLSLESSK